MGWIRIPAAANHDSGNDPVLALDDGGPDLLNPVLGQQGELHGDGNLGGYLLKLSNTNREPSL